ncbi:DUF6531 domain-containing protein [Agromyces sp. S2-1-8]|uniref:DUF6531 domain-containing protein n=1 Tax=Agromyces sp. S2-1-8 TaxID=2897180 RepID=UPI001E5F6B22|nr:DUF6531 domain-containing protein [Agromyces sp. S2-1-8]MCD5348444.1 DUF6531 domain-containing protein [Agromyces sp. S2-1-8]
MRRQWRVWSWRGIAVIVIAGLALQGSVTSAEASPLQLAAEARQAVLDEVRAAAAAERMATENPKDEAAPLAEATLNPYSPATIEAEEVGLAAEFSGNELEAPVDLSVSELGKPARRTAAAETQGVVVSDTVEITATAADGTDVTQFPAAYETTTDDAGVETAVDVVPGVSLALKVDEGKIEANDLDPASLRMLTRETEGEAWTELPSYYDADAGVVRAESSHLSQFVVIGVKFIPPPGPSIVLDPDDDLANTTSPWQATELPYNSALATQLAPMLTDRCLANVVITRGAGVPEVSSELRANIARAANPAVTLTIGFDALAGHGWGSDPSEGGTFLYPRGNGKDAALLSSLRTEMPGYTGRPAAERPRTADLPHAPYNNLPGAVVHMETLYLDNNFDQPVIANGFQHIVNGVFTGLGKYLEAQGFDCTDPVTGGWPARPSKAEIERWRHLGYQNYQTYGADPISFATGNLLEDEPLFTLAGPGEQEIDLTLIYNSQDGRLSRTGAGWSFGLGGRAQRFDDGSVMVVRGDGASFVFNPDGSGGYKAADPGTHLTLKEAGLGQLQLTHANGEAWVYDASDIEGIGELIRHTDRQGNATTLSYGAANPDVHQFVPLTKITDAAGQTVTVGNDAVGRITSFTHPDGRVWKLGYDSAGNLAKITSPDGRVRTFTYDGKHQMATATDAAGVVYLKNEYDSAGRVVKQWDADGNLRTIKYDKGTTTYTDAEGKVTTFTVDDHARITGITNPTGATATYTFDKAGNVTGYVDEAGRKTFTEYDQNGNPTKVTRPGGQVTQYTYTPTGEVASTTDLGGDRTTTNTVNGKGLTTSVLQADGTTVRYEYNAAGDITKVIQPSGATTTYGYDARGNVTKVTDPNGAVTSFAYDAANRMTSTTDPNGNSTTLRWDTADRLVSQTDAAGGITTYSYDKLDRVTSRTDPDGAVTTYGWDKLFRLVTVTAPDGGVSKYAYNREDDLTSSTDPLGNQTKYLLDDLYRPITVVDPNGGEWQRSYDEVGNTTSTTDPEGATITTEFDPADQPTTVAGPIGITEHTTYDDAGRVTKTADADGNEVRYEYDQMDRVVKVTDQEGYVTEYLYDVDGHLVGMVDRNGNPTKYKVDLAGQVVAVTDQTGAVTGYEYDPAGNVIASTNPLGNRSTSTYDALNRVATITDPLGNTTAYGYDPMSRVTSVTDANAHTRGFGYDPAGRVAAVTDAAGGTTTYRYDQAGNQTGMIDGNGNETRYQYDPAAQLVEVIEGYVKDADPSSDVNVSTRYEYTPAGNLAGITDPNEHQTRFEYDPAGQVVKETNPAGTSWSYEYDARGLLTKEATPNGTISYGYTPRGDRATMSFPGMDAEYEYSPEQQLIAMTDPTGATGWKYDPVGRMTEQLDSNEQRLGYSYDVAGQLVTLSMPEGDDIGYAYDKAGNAISLTSPWGDVSSSYDPVGNLTQKERSNGVTTTYDYDPTDRVASITHQTPAPAVSHTPKSPVPVEPLKQTAKECALTSGYLGDRALPNLEGEHPDCVKTWDYLNRRTQPAIAAPALPGDELRYDYTYDPAGNVTNATRTLGAPVSEAPDTATDTAPAPETPAVPEPKTLGRDFSYDSLNRLTESTATTGEVNTYGYDPAGNRTRWERENATDGPDFTVAASYNEVNQVTATTGHPDGDASYRYDSAGNRTGQQIGGVDTSYGYDATGRTTTATDPERSSSYGYDGLGRRTTATDKNQYSTQTTTTVFDRLTPVGTDNNVHGVTTLVRDIAGELELQIGGTDTGERWALLDRLASTVAQTDTNGAITDLSDYTDYGIQDLESVSWGAAVDYTGEPGDISRGTNQFHARTYDPTTGVWAAQDTWRGLLGAPQTLNRYGYVLANPATLVDALGNRPWDPAISVKGKNKDGWVYGPPDRSQVVPAQDDPNDRYNDSDACYDWEPCAKTAELVLPVHRTSDLVGTEPFQVNGRFTCAADLIYQSNAYTNGSCVTPATVEHQRKGERDFFTGLAVTGGIAGLIALGALAIPALGVLGTVAGGVAFVAQTGSTVHACMNFASQSAECIVGGIFVGAPVAGGFAKILIGGRVPPDVLEAISAGILTVGAFGDGTGVLNWLFTR